MDCIVHGVTKSWTRLLLHFTQIHVENSLILIYFHFFSFDLCAVNVIHFTSKFVSNCIVIVITFTLNGQFSSVQFSRPVVSDSLRPHESQHARPSCPSPSPGAHSDSRPLSWWCHLAISSSVIPFSSCPQSLPASGSFTMSQLFTWAGQSIGVSALASVLQWTPRTDLI